MNNREEELYKVIENLKERVQKLEQENQEFKQKFDQFNREKEGFMNELAMIKRDQYIFQEKITIIGIQNNWYNTNSKECQEYTQEEIQFYSQKYHINRDSFKKQVLQLEKKTQTQRLEILQNYFQENPNNKLSINAVMGILKVSWHTAKQDMLQLVKEQEETYEIIKNPVIRKHKNQRKQSRSVLSIQKKGSSL